VSLSEATTKGAAIRRFPRAVAAAGAAATAALLLAWPAGAGASPSIQYGIHDDAWLVYGEGTLQTRVATLKRSGVQIVRFTLHWDEIEPRKGTFDWTTSDKVLRALRTARLPALVTLYGSPRWANGGHAPSWAPTSGAAFASFARAAARRYPWVRKWVVWNEPNSARFLRPTSTSVYVARILNPAYAAIHGVLGSVQVAGGATAPRGGTGGISPIAFVRGMKAAHARLDAYAHHPYPSSAQETPSSAACQYCSTLTMASLPRLLAEVQRDFGDKRIWLTEYGYQTNPPDRLLGVSYEAQALYLSEAALRAYLAPRVDVLIYYLFRDDADADGWQSGIETVAGARKPAYDALLRPLAQQSRTGSSVVLWGQIRSGSGRQTFRLERLAGSRWVAVGRTRVTSTRGFYTLAVQARPGSRFRVRSLRDNEYSPTLTIT